MTPLTRVELWRWRKGGHRNDPGVWRGTRPPDRLATKEAGPGYRAEVVTAYIPAEGEVVVGLTPFDIEELIEHTSYCGDAVSKLRSALQPPEESRVQVAKHETAEETP